MKKAIVTGATGFIGGWMAQELLENEYQVTVIVRNQEKLLPELRNSCVVVEKPLLDIRAEDISSCDFLSSCLEWRGSGQKEFS